jgi:hypothetical protein
VCRDQFNKKLPFIPVKDARVAHPVVYPNDYLKEEFKFLRAMLHLYFTVYFLMQLYQQYPAFCNKLFLK